jgi:hypothetical protein
MRLVLAILLLLANPASADHNQTALDQTRAWFAAVRDHEVDAALALMTTPAYVRVCWNAKEKQPIDTDEIKKRLACEIKTWESVFRKPSWTVSQIKLEVTTPAKVLAAKADRPAEKFLAELKDHVLVAASLRSGAGISYSIHHWYFAVDANGKIDAIVPSWIKVVN